MVCVWDPVVAGVSPYEIVMEQYMGGWLFRGRSQLKAGGPPDLAKFPIRPLALGLTVNTIVYAGLWWLPLFGPGVLRRLFRRRRGHCPACGYDLQGDLANGCPECGWRRTSIPLAAGSGVLPLH